MATTPVTAEKFVTEWQRARNVFTLAKKFNVNINTVCTRAKTYRRKGIPLKNFTPLRHPKSLKFGVRTTPGIVGFHRSRKGISMGLLDIKGLKRLAKSSLRN